MAYDTHDRLRKLKALRDNGTLSAGEYQIARTRLLAAAEDAEADEEPDKPGFLASWWPAFVGFGVLALMIVGLVVYGRMQAEQDATDTTVITSNENSSEADAAPNGSELCASSAAFGMLKDRIFDQGQELYGGDPGPLESLRKVVGARVQYPMLRAIREGDAPVQCGGHVLIDLPPTVHAAFDGLPTLEADIQYTVSQAPGGAPIVTQLMGAEPIVQQLAVAATTVGGKGKGPVLEAAQPKQLFEPSFVCRGQLSSIEQMICEDEQLAGLDRDLAEKFLTLRRELPRQDWQLVNENQRNFLRRRSTCTTAACLHDAYVAQIRALDRFEPGISG